jgi:1-acyl-sn-glycerol-3-phosphate acyltransferase
LHDKTSKTSGSSASAASDTATAAPPRGAAAAALFSKALASVTGNLYLVIGSLVLALVTIVAAWVPPRRQWAFATTRVWAAGVLAASGVRLTVHGTGGLPNDANFVYLANHQSLFDIPALLCAIPGGFRFVAKQSLFRIPIFGTALSAAGFVSVDRGDRAAARQSFAAAEEGLRGGDSILLFPEGTRSTTGMLLPFKRGGFLLALRSGLPIVPVGIRGTLAVQPRGRRSIQPGAVEVRFGTPIDTAQYGIRRKRELIREVRARLAELAGVTAAADADADAEDDA